MKKFNLRLNLKKCTFAVKTEKFLGFMMTERGIEPNSEKVRAITEMQPPRSVKDVKKLTGRLATLSCFLSKLDEKSLSFFQILKKAKAFTWTDEYQRAFEDLKEYLASSTMLSKPEKDEVLYIYLAVADRVINLVLIREDDKKAQRPIYYVSKALTRAEL